MDGHFETLVYTDCRPGQGLRGTAGLQFQARSSDPVAAAETLVKDHLLYEPPSRWMADRRPVEDYPRSFAHLCASGYLATATGLYLGREANGVRQGNQLTHAIVTRDPESYRGLRPAQLYGADFWTSTPAATTRSDPVTVRPAGGPYSPARAKKFVLERPNGPGMLLALVTALEQAGTAGAGRVLFLGDDMGDIVEWLVAGTLLIPRAHALELGFKIYSNDPARSSAPIVAVHPEFAGPATRVDNQLGYLVFDLTAHRNTPIAESESARRWVGLFLDGNPRDAVDALDVAAESGIRDDERAAAALGLAAILHQEPSDPHAETIVGWLRWGPQRLRDAYGADLADIFAEEPDRWSRRVLRLLDEVGSDGLLLPGKAAEVRIALLLKDIEEAVGGGEVTAERPAALPPGEWGPERDAQVRDLLLDRLGEPETPGRTVEALLRVAHRYGADLHPATLGPAAGELARFLADHSDLMRPADWPNGTEVDGLLRAELHQRAARGGAAPALVGDVWRRWLLKHRHQLSAVLLASALGAAVRIGDDRATMVPAELDAVADDPDEYARRVADLFSQAAPQPDEMWLIAESAPDGTPPLTGVFRGLADIVGGKGPVTTDQLQLCRRLVRRGLLEPARPVEVAVAADSALTRTLASMRAEPGTDQLKDLLHDLAATPPRLIEPRAGTVVAALLAPPVFRPADKVFDRNAGLLDPYLRELIAALGDEKRPALAASAFYLRHGRLNEDKARRSDVGKALDHWLVRAPDKRIEEAGAQLTAVGGRTWTKAWEERVESVAGRRRRHRVTHPFGGRS